MAFLDWIALGFYCPPSPLPLSLRRPPSQNQFRYQQLHCQHLPTTTFTPQLPSIATATGVSTGAPQLPLPPPLPPPLLVGGLTEMCQRRQQRERR